MLSKLKRKFIRSVKRRLRDRKIVIVLAVTVLLVGTIGYATYMSNKRLTVDTATLGPLLSVIAKAESNDNYNAYFGQASNTAIKFTDMTIAQVLQWQANYIQQGNASSAVGRYQIINTTLSELVQRLNIDTSQKFNKATQDSFAIALLDRRGANDYINNQLTADQFAANLAKEWAGLPKITGPNPGDSYYSGDGLNKSRVGVDEVKKAIEPISAK